MSSSMTIHFLTNILGGEEKYQEILEQLKAQAVISELNPTPDSFAGILTDEDGLRWHFECSAVDVSKIDIVIKNHDVMYLCKQEPTKAIAANEMVTKGVILASDFPKGHFQFTSESIKDILFLKLQTLSYINFCLSLGMTNNVDKERLQLEIDEMNHSGYYLSRSDTKMIIPELSPDPIRRVNYIEILANMFGPVDVIDVHDAGPHFLALFQAQQQPDTMNSLQGPQQQNPVVPRQNPVRAVRRYHQ